MASQISEISSKIISFQMKLHLLITLVRSSDYFRFIESLRTCIMASHIASSGCWALIGQCAAGGNASYTEHAAIRTRFLSAESV